VLWRRFKRWVRNSWLGNAIANTPIAFTTVVSAGQDVRRPLSSLRSPQVESAGFGLPPLNRWFRKTWVGREFGWILDEFTLLLVFLQIEAAQTFSQRRVRRFFSRKQNIAVLVVMVLVALAGYRYGRPHYQHYVETQYAGQAEQFMLKATSPAPICAPDR